MDIQTSKAVPKWYAPIQTSLLDTPEQGGELKENVFGSLDIICRKAEHVCLNVEIHYYEYSSEWGHEGESHQLWGLKGFPVFHERREETRDRCEDGEFLIRVTTSSGYKARTLMLTEDGIWHMVYWEASSRTTEHGSERRFDAKSEHTVSFKEAADIIGLDRLAHTLAGLPVEQASKTWKPYNTPHLSPSAFYPKEAIGQEKSATETEHLFTLTFPQQDRCMTLNESGRILWIPVPKYGRREYHYREEYYDPDLESDAWLKEDDIDAGTSQTESPEDEDRPAPSDGADTEENSHGGEFAVPIEITDLPDKIETPIGRRNIKKISGTPPEWS